MALETEIKVQISSKELEVFRSQLIDIGASQISPRKHESNLIFDFSEGTLRNSNCALRLRTYGKQTTLTFKGTPRSDPLFKQREELESLVSDKNQIQQILQNLGMSICFEYSKFREIYSYTIGEKQVLIFLDETLAGTFVELEGSSENIQNLANKLGWTPDQFIQETYIALIKNSSRKSGPNKKKPSLIK